jgi:hypothetical protein
MNTYRIVDNGKEIYDIKADNAQQAILNWIQTYSSPDVLEFIAENAYEYIARLQIRKI